MKPVVSMKLSTGEEVIGTVNADDLASDKEELFINNPRRLEVSMGRDGLAGISLIPFMVACPEGEVVLNRKHIVAISTNVPKQLEDGYLQQTSGIQLV